MLILILILMLKVGVIVTVVSIQMMAMMAMMAVMAVLTVMTVLAVAPAHAVAGPITPAQIQCLHLFPEPRAIQQAYDEIRAEFELEPDDVTNMSGTFLTPPASL